jgi:hypothetical protein
VLDVSPDLLVGRGVRIDVVPRTRTVIRIGPSCRIGDRVLLRLAGPAAPSTSGRGASCVATAW